MSFKVGVICSEFHKDLVEALYKGAATTLSEHSVKVAIQEWVPGAGEIPQVSRWLLKKCDLDGLLALGVVIRGETSHHESLCRILEKGLLSLQKECSLPVIFSVLMLENRFQAESRLGGPKGHRGCEAALALVKMLKLRKKIQNL